MKPAFSVVGLLKRRSVLRDDRATPAIVDANGDEIDVIADAIGAEGEAAWRDEAKIAVLHEQVIVFDAGRPVGSEAKFEARADAGAPAGVVARGSNYDTRGNIADAVTIRGDGRTTLDIEQNVVGGPADLTGEQAEGVGPRFVREAGEKQALIAAR